MASSWLQAWQGLGTTDVPCLGRSCQVGLRATQGNGCQPLPRVVQGSRSKPCRACGCVHGTACTASSGLDSCAEQVRPRPVGVVEASRAAGRIQRSRQSARRRMSSRHEGGLPCKPASPEAGLPGMLGKRTAVLSSGHCAQWGTVPHSAITSPTGSNGQSRVRSALCFLRAQDCPSPHSDDVGGPESAAVCGAP